MNFTVSESLLTHARTLLANRRNLYWVVGGSGSGKSTICAALSERHAIPVCDMDEHIYGDYHSRFTADRHPANTAWSGSENPLAWLIGLTWDEFYAFNRAALPEYLDLFCEDLASTPTHESLVIDGGICNPGLAAQVISPHQIVCLEAAGVSSSDVWEGSEQRLQMKEMVLQLPNPDAAWETFLEFDQRISHTCLTESRESGIPVCTWAADDSVGTVAQEVARHLGIESV